MPTIVAVHGINMNRQSREAMEQAWRSAITEGLHDVRNNADPSIECAFYGHLYNDGKALGIPPYNPYDLTAGFERDLFLALAGEDPDTAATKMYLPSAMQRAAARLQRSRPLDGLNSAVIHWIKQVNRYFEDNTFAAKVAAEMAAAMTSSPQAVVAHSLGSIVAYDWLRGSPGPFTGTLITIGSPLGFSAIRDRLGLRGPAGWPGLTKHWVNVAAREDAVAIIKELRPLYDPRVRDYVVSNPRSSAHSAQEYLRNVATAEALAAALG